MGMGGWLGCSCALWLMLLAAAAAQKADEHAAHHVGTGVMPGGGAEGAAPGAMRAASFSGSSGMGAMVGEGGLMAAGLVRS